METEQTASDVSHDGETAREYLIYIQAGHVPCYLDQDHDQQAHGGQEKEEPWLTF